MKLTYYVFAMAFLLSFGMSAQDAGANKASYVGTVESMRIVPSLSSRTVLEPAVPLTAEPNDGRSSRNDIVIGKDRQDQNDYYSRNPHPLTSKIPTRAPINVFTVNNNVTSPSDPSLAVGPNHVFIVYNTGFIIYDKDGNDLTGPLNVNNIFSSGGCCDLTVSYDNAADRWVVSYLFIGAGIEVAVSDGPDPTTANWFVYSIPEVDDYNKLSVWSDGYYITDNTGSADKVWAMDRTALLAGDAGASIQGFDLPGIVTSGFFSPQVLNVTDDNLPATGGASVIYMQDDAWAGVTEDHIKLWTIDVDFAVPANSTISAPTEYPTVPFIGVFDGGSFSNLTQPGNGIAIDALQATIMNQAQFRKFGGHNSALFNFVIDTDASSGEKAAVRWYEFRQPADNTPWTMFQEGTYSAPDTGTGGEKHAWHASMMMDASGNIGMGYSAMTVDPNDPDPVRVSSYYTGRFASDPLNTMTIAEELISLGDGNIPGNRYGDYSKIDLDPVNDKEFWFINEHRLSGGANTVGVFQIAPNFNNDVGVVSIDTPVTGTLTATEDVTVTIFNFGLDPASNFDVTYQIDGGALVTETFAGPLASATSAQFTFATQADLSVVGQTYAIVACTALTGDEDTNNDCSSSDVTHLEPNDIGVSSIVAPSSGANLGAAEEVTVTITNFGGATQTDFDVTFDLDGTMVTEVVPGPLAGDSTINYTFTATVDLSAFGSYNLCATTSLAGDSDTTNDEICVTVTNSNCQPETNCTEGDGIQRLQLENVDNNSGCDTDGYGDYTNLTVELPTSGTTYDLTITTGYGDQFVRAWIDYNDDFVFSLDELVVDNFEIADGQAAGTYTETMDLVVPGDATLGQHLMRVKTNWNGPVPNDACEETQFGETEDYTVNIDGVLGVDDALLDSDNFSVISQENNMFEMTFTTTQYTDKLEFTVHNVMGQQLLVRRLENEGGEYKYNLNMNYAGAGVYLLRLGTENSGLVKKIVVK